MSGDNRTAYALLLLAAICAIAYVYLKSPSASKSVDASKVAVFSVPQSGMQGKLPVGETPISQGGYGVVPWGSNANFIDPTAAWLWERVNARFSSPPATLDFSALITNPSKQDLPVVIHVLVDNDCEIYLNDKRVGSASMGFSTTDYNKIPVSIPWGTNALCFRTTNTGSGPAGLIVAVVDAVSGVTLLKTEPSTWVFERVNFGQTK